MVRTRVQPAPVFDRIDFLTTFGRPARRFGFLGAQGLPTFVMLMVDTVFGAFIFNAVFVMALNFFQVYCGGGNKPHSPHAFNNRA